MLRIIVTSSSLKMLKWRLNAFLLQLSSKLVQEYVLVCVRYKTQTDKNSGLIHPLCCFRQVYGGVVILSTINEVEALGLFKDKIMTEIARGQDFSDADFLRLLNPPKSLHFNWSLLSSCENTAVSWKNQCLQNWRSRRTVSSNPQILPKCCCCWGRG